MTGPGHTAHYAERELNEDLSKTLAVLHIRSNHHCANKNVWELILICNHCGKEVGTLKSAILELHEQGKTPLEIREELKARLKGTERQKLMTVHVYLHTYAAKY